MILNSILFRPVHLHTGLEGRSTHVPEASLGYIVP